MYHNSTQFAPGMEVCRPGYQSYPFYNLRCVPPLDQRPGTQLLVPDDTFEAQRGYKLASIDHEHVARTAEWKTIVTTVSVVIALGISVLVGVIFGIYPTMKASEISPIEALRYE